jgi:hypothetical protein
MVMVGYDNASERYAAHFPEESMDILMALKQEQARLQQQVKGIHGAILALNDSHSAPSRAQLVSHKGVTRKRTMSAAARAKISKATKERWAKFRAEKSKKAK